MAAQPVWTAPGAALRTPPEQQFWQRYSPHHEAPLSGIGTFAVHILLAGFLLMAGYLGWLSLGRSKIEPKIDVVRLDRGGNGRPDLGNGPSDGGQPKEVADLAAPEPNSPPSESSPRPDLATPKSATPLPPQETGKDANERIIKDANSNLQKLERLNNDLQKKLGFLAGARSGSERKGGSGDHNRGPGDGPDRGTIDRRMQRTLRWRLDFDTRNGEDYLRQLRGLGAILAIPKDSSGKENWIIRDLAGRPPKLLNEDVTSFNRIFWIDDKAQTVASVMRALALDQKPERFIAFMPKELEDKLFDLEKSYRGLKEDEIQETVFKVRVENDKFTPYVVQQSKIR
jgi:hypothetical protein